MKLAVGDEIVHFDEVLIVDQVSEAGVVLRPPYGLLRIVVPHDHENYWRHCRKYATS